MSDPDATLKRICHQFAEIPALRGKGLPRIELLRALVVMLGAMLEQMTPEERRRELRRLDPGEWWRATHGLAYGYVAEDQLRELEEGAYPSLRERH